MSEDAELSFEEFNNLIDSSHDEGCSCCFSFHHFKHLSEANRKIAYLGWIDKDNERVIRLAYELDLAKDQPIDDNIYFLVTQAELLDTRNIKVHQTITQLVLARAKEMIAKKMPTAWVAVRSYAWIRESNLAVLPELMESTDDLDVWQVCLQCMDRRGLSLPDLLFCRDRVYRFTVKALDMGDTVKSYVVANNGVQALMRLLDERAIELWHKLPRHSLDRNIIEQCDWLIKQLTEARSTQYVPVLMELKQLSEKNKGP